jgi:hypothetical protein
VPALEFLLRPLGERRKSPQSSVGRRQSQSA